VIKEGSEGSAFVDDGKQERLVRAVSAGLGSGDDGKQARLVRAVGGMGGRMCRLRQRVRWFNRGIQSRNASCDKK
jgi:hypothetical protein